MLAPNPTSPFARRYGPGPLWALILLFLLIGTIGHDPWKLDDAIHFGVVWRALADGQALLFMVPGEATLRPPLYYWIAGASGALLGDAMPLPDAVRIASALLAGLTAIGLWSTSRALFHEIPTYAIAAPLALAGSLGFLVHGHEAQPLLASCAALAWWMAALTRLNERRVHAVGLGALTSAAMFLAGGLALMPAMLLMTATVIVQARHHLRCALSALAIFAGGTMLSFPWLWKLAQTHPDALARWQITQVSRLMPGPQSAQAALDYLEMLPWFAWPALPLALWALWTASRQREFGRIALPLAAVVGIWVSLSLSEAARNANAILLITALATLSPYAMATLRRGADSAFDWFGRMTFSVVAALIWLGWSAIYFAVPARIGRNFARLGPGFSGAVEPISVALAVLATVLWCIVLVRSSRYPLRSLVHWTGGMALLWCLVFALWLPWIEHIKSYRETAAKLAAELNRNARPGCVIGHQLGAAQRASLEYFLDRRFLSLRRGNEQCTALIIQGSVHETAPPEGWHKQWEGARAGDRNERLRLYVRAP